MTIQYESCLPASNGDERIRMVSTNRGEVERASTLAGCVCSFGAVRVGHRTAQRLVRRSGKATVTEHYPEKVYNVIHVINIECTLHSQYNSPYPVAKTVMK